MIAFVIIVAAVFVLGSLTIYAFCSYAEHKGYMRGIAEAEEIIKEVRGHEEN